MRFCYDGSSIGKFDKDAIRNIAGKHGWTGATVDNVYSGVLKGTLKGNGYTWNNGSYYGLSLELNAGLAVPTDGSNRPASIAFQPCVSF